MVSILLYNLHDKYVTNLFRSTAVWQPVQRPRLLQKMPAPIRGHFVDDAVQLPAAADDVFNEDLFPYVENDVTT